MSLFLKSIGDSLRNRVLEFFIEGRELDYSLKDVMTNCDLSKTLAMLSMHDLIEDEMILPTRKVSKIQLFKLNLKDRPVIGLCWVFDDLIKVSLEDIKKPQVTEI